MAATTRFVLICLAFILACSQAVPEEEDGAGARLLYGGRISSGARGLYGSRAGGLYGSRAGGLHGGYSDPFSSRVRGMIYRGYGSSISSPTRGVYGSRISSPTRGVYGSRISPSDGADAELEERDAPINNCNICTSLLGNVKKTVIANASPENDEQRVAMFQDLLNTVLCPTQILKNACDSKGVYGMWTIVMGSSTPQAACKQLALC